jgi:hypothetical protein
VNAGVFTGANAGAFTGANVDAFWLVRGYFLVFSTDSSHPVIARRQPSKRNNPADQHAVRTPQLFA